MCSSPRLIAAYHVLRRLSMPRHPPCALLRLIPLLGATVFSVWIPSPDYTLRHNPHNIPPSVIKELEHQAMKAKGLGEPHTVQATPEAFPGRAVAQPYSAFQKGGDPAAGSPTATLLRLRPSH